LVELLDFPDRPVEEFVALLRWRLGPFFPDERFVAMQQP